jgi:hypothetical protein
LNLDFRLIFTAFSNQFSSLPKFKRHRRIVLEEVEIAHKTEQNYHRQESSRAHEAELSRIVELKEWHIYEKERSFLHLLHTSDYMFYKNMNPEPSLGTCQWLLRHKTFVKWQKTELNLLLILLEPGCGKSVLARSLVDCCQAGNPLTTLADESAMNICYFFFQDESESRREARYAISAILHQLLAQNDSQLKKTFQRNLELPDKSSYKGLWSLLQELVLDGGPPIVCIIDSLDECEELSRSNFIKSLTNLLSQPVARSRLKVIITCRPYIAIREAFDATGFNSDQIAYLGEDPKDKLDIQLEISQFIERKVLSFQSVRFNRTGIHDDAHLLVRDWIVSKDNQSYLWLSLIFPKLEANASLPKDDLRNLIDALPETVSKAYEKMLKKCSDPRKARNILHIIIAATRPLRLSEVNLVLSIQEGRKILKEADMIPETCLAKTLQELCGYFIRIVEERVYLYHQTAKEFLQKSEGGLTSVVNSITPVNTAVSQHLNTTTVF